MDIPDFLINLGKESSLHQEWVDALPALIKGLEKEWKLEIGRPFIQHASCSFVAPCLVNNKEQAVLKIGWPHEEGLHEIEGLRLLNGHPTVRLLRFDKEINSMLLERCMPGTALSREADAIQDEIICRLLKDIWKTNYKRENFRPLAVMVKQWNEETYQQLDLFPDPELAKSACQLKEQLIKSTKKRVLLATDLHAGNVLRAQRQPWLVIDIKPYVGDPTYDLTQHLLNNLEKLKANPSAIIDQLATLAGVDPFRLKQWMFARLASENGGAHQELAKELG